MDWNHGLSVKLVGVMALLAIVVLVATACVGRAPAGNSGQVNVISVSGQGKASGTPNVAYVELGIDVRNTDLNAALAESNRVMGQVQEAVKGAGVATEDVQTASFNVWVEDRYEEGDPRGQAERIYHVFNTVRLTVRDIGTTGDVIGAGLDAGANTVNSLSFGISDPSALEAEARALALADAQERARQLADGLGVKLGAPVTVSESPGGGVPVFERAVMAADMAAAPPISEGQLTVTMVVNISFEIEQ